MKHEKVTLPREVAEAIEKARSKSWADADLMDITNFIDESYQPSDGPYRSIGEYISDVYLEENLPKYMSALVNGYDVEESPEEKLREYYGFHTEKCYVTVGEEHIEHLSKVAAIH